jgi:hypothetical protein
MTDTSELPEWHATTSSIDLQPKLPGDSLVSRHTHATGEYLSDEVDDRVWSWSSMAAEIMRISIWMD